ncbi:basigin [Thrips palmi]|uniref:Basigin n=1 Tax=Thrips palmi TaxID=161013 RepID=A0A6P8ZR40_THRPL|nr:basigin [Thrips palmi]
MDTLRSMRPSAHALALLIVLGCFLKLSAAANSVVANTDHENYKTMEYNKQLVLQCNVSNAESANQFVMTWLKEGKPVVPDDKIKIIESENKLVISKASEEHYGNYTCQAVNKKTNATENVMKKSIHVIMGPVITMPSDTPVVEGERLRLHCSVKGYPTPLVDWSVDGKVVNISDSRIKFEDDRDVRKAYLLIENVQMSDRHSYKCKASNIANQDNTGAEAATFVRVKDKLAALWPFLGICAEVAILCTIILIYEKKRNKAELDESDTDQSPEQKNTPDHGKDVRQRK